MKILFSPPDMSEAEVQAVAEVIRSGWITTGPKTKEFEKKIAGYCHTNKAICLNSQTACAEMALRLLGVRDGDEILVPAYTYTASASVVCHVGAKLVLIDSQKDSIEMDYDAMANAINEKTKVIIPVDLGGIPCDYDRIFSIVEKKKSLFRPANQIQEAIGRIAICADAAHAFGASWHGRRIGEIADMTSFSFHAVKNISTAEGGALTWKSIPGFDDEKLYQQAQLYSLHGQSKDALLKTQPGSWEYDVVGPWYKCNMTDIMAAIGLKQLERYPVILNRRQEIISRYDQVCDELGILHMEHYGNDFVSSGHLYLARLPGMDEAKRNDMILRMAKRGIACNVHYKPLAMMSAYKAMGWRIEEFPNAYGYYRNEVTLPLHTRLTEGDVEYVAAGLREVIREICGEIGANCLNGCRFQKSESTMRFFPNERKV